MEVELGLLELRHLEDWLLEHWLLELTPLWDLLLLLVVLLLVVWVRDQGLEEVTEWVESLVVLWLMLSSWLGLSLLVVLLVHVSEWVPGLVVWNLLVSSLWEHSLDELSKVWEHHG